jgi:FkbM family methyltransferase
MRPGTTDINVYYQIFVEHQLRYLYTLFAADPPKYVLDAGANAGYAASLFKLLWPDAIVVSVEPDPKNYETLVKNTAKFKGMHAVNAGLWGHKAKIGRVASHGEWGHVFKEVKNGDDGLKAYGVKDLLQKFKLPRFDFVKIDIEGAEGMVMAPGEDLSWINDSKVVSLEVHDFFASYFGLGKTDISQRVEAAFKGRHFGRASDNEHTLFINYELLKTLQP